MVLYREDWKRERNARVEAVKRKSVVEKTVEEYRTESKSILNDYSEAMTELRFIKREKENLQQMLTRTSQELTHQREELQDKLAHMDAQVGGPEWA